jgi:hypothetical protein
MNLKRPVAGAILSMLILVSGVALAAPVVDLTPPDLSPPEDSSRTTGPADTRPEDPAATGPARQVASSARGESDGEGSYEVDVQPSLQTRHFGAANVACQVADSSRDLVVTNNSPDPLPAGTRIKWQLKAEGKRGYFAIINALGGGQSLVADDVVEGGAKPGEECVARVI